MLDTYKLKGLRAKLVQALREKGIVDESVLEAMLTVPRHFFVDSALAETSYEDIALPITEGQTISQPYTVAYQTQLLEVRKGMKVLEIGTGSGYQAAVLCQIGVQLFSVECIKSLYERAKERLSDLGFKPVLKWGDGSQGWVSYAPFDRIVVTAGAPVVPQTLKSQLSVGGKMVIPVGDRNSQRMLCIRRITLQEFEIQEYDYFKFVPLTGREGWGA